MQDRFRGKTWIFWAQVICLGGLGSFSVIFGTLFWTGAMMDAKGEARPQAGPPMVIIGCCLLVVAALAVFNIVGRMTPIIRCYRDGIECNLVGASSLDGVPFVPSLFRVAWTILSLQGFRSQRLRILWEDFDGAWVGGVPMAYVLTLSGTAANAKSELASNSIAFKQVALKDHPQEVADVLNCLADEPAQRKRLPHWPPYSSSTPTDSESWPTNNRYSGGR